MAVVVTADQRASTNPIMKEWVAAKDREGSDLASAQAAIAAQRSPQSTPLASGGSVGAGVGLTANPFQSQSPTPVPQADPALVAQHQAAAQQFEQQHWYNGGTTATPTTEAQNISNVYNQKGNTAPMTPYIQSQLDQAAKDTSAQSKQPGTFNPAGVAGSGDTTPGDQSLIPISKLNPGYNLDAITKTATDSVNGKIATQIAAYNQALASSQQANQLAVTQNGNYLDSQIQDMNQQHLLDGNSAQQLQNRRGGFYSGGLDYQLGSQDRAYATSEGKVRQDVQARNNDLFSKNALMATQAAENIQRLQSQAPDMIRQAIQDEIDKQRGLNIQEAGITGKYNGQNTMQQNNSNVSNSVAVAGLTGNYTSPEATALQTKMDANSAAYANASPAEKDRLHQENIAIAAQLGKTYDPNTGAYSSGNGTVRTVAGQNADLNKMQTMASLTGYMSDGKGGYVPTNAKQQQDLTNAWKETEQLGSVTPALSRLTGIQAGTPTQAAKNQASQIAISQANSNASIANMNADNTRADNAIKLTAEQRDFAGTLAGELAQAKSKEDVINFWNANAAAINKKLGPDAATKMKNDALAPYDKVTPSAKLDTTIREKAVAAAQKDFRWADTKVDRNALIKEYEAFYN